MVFHSSKAKKVSDIFELNGPVMSANAMTTLLFGFVFRQDYLTLMINMSTVKL